MSMLIAKDGALCVIDCYDERDKVKLIGASWDKQNRMWIMPLTIANVDLCLQKLNEPLIESSLEEALIVQKEKEKKLARIVELSKKNSNIQFKIPGVKASLFNYQKFGVVFALTNDEGFLLADEMGLGKALAAQGFTLTPSGWKKNCDIKVGDYLIGKNGEPTKVIGVYPQGKKDSYKVTFTDGYSVECCDEHLWEVNTPCRKNRCNKAFVKSLREIIDSGLTRKNGKNGVRYNWYIPIVDAVRFDKKDLKIPPYVLGVLLGDGTLKSNTIQLTSSDDELIERVRNLIEDLGVDVSKKKSKYQYSFIIADRTISSQNLLSKFIKDNNLKKLSCDKHIPKNYLYSSIEDRIELLRGLMDTDGTVLKGKRGNIPQYCTTSKKLCDDFAELIQGLGGVVTVNEKNPFYYNKKRERVYCKKAYIISINLPVGLCPFHLSRKSKLYNSSFNRKYLPNRAISSVEYVGEKEMVCFAVDADDKLFVTENYIVTHNTIQAIAMACVRKYKYGITSCLVIVPASVKWNWPLEIEKFTNESYVVISGSPEDRVKQWKGLKTCKRIHSVKGGSVYEYVDSMEGNKPFFYITNYELLTEDLFGGRKFNINEEDTSEVKARKMRMIDKAKSREARLMDVREHLWDCIIVDECFHPESRIRCSDGRLLNISKIVVNKLKLNVDSYNEVTGKIESKPIVGWFKNSVRQCYKLQTDAGVSYPTGNHKYYTPYGMKIVDDLNIGDKIYYLDKSFSKRQIGVIAGTLLGDGSICGNGSIINKQDKKLFKKVKCRRYRVAFNHSTVQEEYARWKSSLLGDCNISIIDNKGFGDKLIRVQTKSLIPETLYNVFCKSNKKSVNNEWLDLVDDLGLAIWFMDDGSCNKSVPSLRWKNNVSVVDDILKKCVSTDSRRMLVKKYGISENVAKIICACNRGNFDVLNKNRKYSIPKQYARFHTEGFSYEDNCKLSVWLKTRWGIDNSVVSAGKYYRLNLTQDGTNVLFSIISRYIPECMRYKLRGFLSDEYSLNVESEDFVVKDRLCYGTVLFKDKHKVSCTTYNIEVKDNHNYFCGNTLVSNCHYIKSHNSGRSKQIKALNGTFKVGLTGTPVDGRLEELHSIMEFVKPGLFTSKHRFLQRHADFDFWGKITKYKKIDEVREKIKPFFLRRMKKEVLKDLPDKIYQNRHIELSPKERKIYDQLADCSHPITEDTEAMVKVIRCKQFCDHPEILGEDCKSSKMELFLEIMEELIKYNGEKVIVFTQYVAALNLIRREMTTKGYRFLEIGGGCAKKARIDVQEQFNVDPNIDAVIGTEAMSLGLNLQAASYVINYDDNWSPSLMRQREDRAHRSGQKNTVTVINFVCDDTIEERIRDMLYNKEVLSSEILGDNTDEMVLRRLGPLDVLKLL